MIKTTTRAILASTVMALTGTAAFADGHGEITVGYFLEWPMPFQFAKVNGTYDEALGVKVNWVASTQAQQCPRRWHPATCRFLSAKVSTIRCRDVSGSRPPECSTLRFPMLRTTTALLHPVWRSTKTPRRTWLARKLRFHLGQPRTTASCARWTTSVLTGVLDSCRHGTS